MKLQRRILNFRACVEGCTKSCDTPYDLRPRFRESSKGVVFTTLVTF